MTIYNIDTNTIGYPSTNVFIQDGSLWNEPFSWRYTTTFTDRTKSFCLQPKENTMSLIILKNIKNWIGA